MEIKIYTKGDEQTAVDLWQESLAGLGEIVDDRIDISKRLSTPSQFFFVASIEKQVVGTALAGITEETAQLDHLAVKPDFRRQGIATALIEKVEQQLGNSGCTSMKIFLDSANETALAFLSKRVYRLEGVVGMRKHLTPLVDNQ